MNNTGLGHFKTYELIASAKEYVALYYETDDKRHLNNPDLYNKLSEAARRWALTDLGRDKRVNNPENYIHIVAHEAVTNVYLKLALKEVDLELFSYYYKKIIRNRICDVFRELADEGKLRDLDSLMLNNSLQFSSEEEVTELLYLRDKVNILTKYTKSCLRTSLLTKNTAHLLVVPILLCVVRNNTKLVDNYPFRTRVFLRKVIFDARSLYIKSFLKND